MSPCWQSSPCLLNLRRIFAIYHMSSCSNDDDAYFFFLSSLHFAAECMYKQWILLLYSECFIEKSQPPTLISAAIYKDLMINMRLWQYATISPPPILLPFNSKEETIRRRNSLQRFVSPRDHHPLYNYKSNHIFF